MELNSNSANIQDVSETSSICDLSDLKPQRSGDIPLGGDHVVLLRHSAETTDAPVEKCLDMADSISSEDQSDVSPSVSRQSPEFDCMGLWDIGSTDDSTNTSEFTETNSSSPVDSSGVQYTDFLGAQKDLSFTDPSFFWKSVPYDNGLDSDPMIPLDRYNLTLYQTDPCFEYQQGSTILKGDLSSNHDKISSLSCAQNSVPLRIPDFASLTDSSNPRSVCSDLSLNHQDVDSTSHFLSGIFPSADFYKDNIDFGTEFSSNDQSSEFFNKPRLEITSLSADSGLVKSFLTEDLHTGSQQKVLDSNVTSPVELNDPWQQLCIDSAYMNRSTSDADFQTYHASEPVTPVNPHETDLDVTQGQQWYYTHDDLQLAFSSSKLPSNNSFESSSQCPGGGGGPPSAYTSPLSSVSCDGSTVSSDTNDSDTSSVHRPINTPPNPLAQTFSPDYEPWLQTPEQQDSFIFEEMRPHSEQPPSLHGQLQMTCPREGHVSNCETPADMFSNYAPVVTNVVNTNCSSLPVCNYNPVSTSAVGNQGYLSTSPCTYSVPLAVNACNNFSVSSSSFVNSSTMASSAFAGGAALSGSTYGSYNLPVSTDGVASIVSVHNSSFSSSGPLSTSIFSQSAPVSAVGNFTPVSTTVFKDSAPLPTVAFGNCMSSGPFDNSTTMSGSCIGSGIEVSSHLATPHSSIPTSINCRGTPGTMLQPASSFVSGAVYSMEQLQRSQPSSLPHYVPCRSGPLVSTVTDLGRSTYNFASERKVKHVFIERQAEPEQIKLVPISENIAPQMKPYQCPLEWYGRSSGRYTAIQPLPTDPANMQRYCDHSIRDSSRKRGAVSIKTKDGKFLCMASDFHTKTVRELLESAETCKEKATAVGRCERIDKVDGKHIGLDSDSSKQFYLEQFVPSIEPPANRTEPLGEKQCTLSEELLSKLQEPSEEGKNSSAITVEEELEESVCSPTLDSQSPKCPQPERLTESTSSYEPSQVQQKENLAVQQQTSDKGDCTIVTENQETNIPVITSVVNSTPCVPTSIFSGDILPVRSDSVARALPLEQSLSRERELIYHGAVVITSPFRQTSRKDSTVHSPAPKPVPDNVQQVLYNHGDGTNFYSPILPPREVQLRTAQPYPLLSCTSKPGLHPPSSVSYSPYRGHCPTPDSDDKVSRPSQCSPANIQVGGWRNSPTGWTQAYSISGSSTCNVCQATKAPINVPFDSGSRSLDCDLPVPPDFVFSQKLKEEREGLEKMHFKPKHFEFTSLQIGNYKYSCPLSDNKTAKIKVIFSRRKLVYEFQLNNMEDVYETHRKKLALVEIPFKHVCGLWGEGRTLKVEVGVPPKVFQGEQLLRKESKFGTHLNARYNRTREEDMTEGEVHHVPYHHIHLKGNSVEKLKHHLELFDARFELLLHLPFSEKPDKFLEPDKTLDLFPAPVLEKATELKKEKDRCVPAILLKRRDSLYGCHCATGCRTARCSCSKQLKACDSTCQCKNCSNLINVLNNCKISTADAKADSCLIQNLFKVVNLERFLRTEILLTCCDQRVTIRQCVPGEVACPSYPRCLARYKFSWCTGTLCDQAKNPRNHCKICQCCCGQQYRHCGSCNRCYFAGSRGFSCPNCSTSETRIRGTKSIGMLLDADMIRNILPT